MGDAWFGNEAVLILRMTTSGRFREILISGTSRGYPRGVLSGRRSHSRTLQFSASWLFVCLLARRMYRVVYQCSLVERHTLWCRLAILFVAAPLRRVAAPDLWPCSAAFEQRRSTCLQLLAPRRPRAANAGFSWLTGIRLSRYSRQISSLCAFCQRLAKGSCWFSLLLFLRGFPVPHRRNAARHHSP